MSTASRSDEIQFNNTLVQKIKEYWKERGGTPYLHVEPMRVKQHGDAPFIIVSIRSNMVNGLPEGVRV